MTDMVNHPSHYRDIPEGFAGECIEYTRWMPFAVGNAFRYVYRAGSKWNTIEDLDKAIWYLEDVKYHAIYADVFAIGHLVPYIYTENNNLRAEAAHQILLADNGTIDSAIQAVTTFKESF